MAWRDGRRHKGNPMKKIIIAIAIALLLCGHAFARSAQSVADENAKAGRLRHLGGYEGCLEGIGMASTKEKAYSICCYASRKDLVTVDVGYAKGRNGMWYCCRRYLRRSK